MASNPPPIILQSGNQPRHSIIWLHGLGADGQDFVPIVNELNLPVAVRYIFPHAPMRPVTVNGGFVMRAWYDITREPPSSLTRTGSDAHQDAAGIRASQTAVEALIAQEVASGIAPGNIILAGFSQGGAIVLHTALRQAAPLGGVLALSTYLPLAASAPDEMLAGARATPFSWRMAAAIRSYPSSWEPIQEMRCRNSAMQWNGTNTRCHIRCAWRSLVTSRFG